MIGLLVGALAMLGWFNPFALWYFLGWSILAGFVFRHVWAPVRVDDTVASRVARRFPTMGSAIAPTAGRLFAVTVVVALGAVGAYVWFEGDTLLRFLIVLLLGTGLTVVTLLHLTSG